MEIEEEIREEIKEGGISKRDYRKAMAIIEAFRSQQEVPKPLETPNFKVLCDTTTKYIDLLRRAKISHDDFKEEIFIAAMEACFGDTLWDWVNANTKRP